jgi:hypothetical protein
MRGEKLGMVVSVGLVRREKDVHQLVVLISNERAWDKLHPSVVFPSVGFPGLILLQRLKAPSISRFSQSHPPPTTEGSIHRALGTNSIHQSFFLHSGFLVSSSSND